jgi:diguanylate cyclase (GGDEF)-like protein
MVLHDVRHTRVMARELSYQATHDELTGLYNRREFERQLRIAADSARLDERGHALCYLDMDQFKVINDTCGHVAGDELLRQFTALLQKQVRDTDVIARLGGDEFGILLNHCSVENASRLANALVGKVREFRFHWQDRRFDVGVSIGLVAITENNKDVSEILSAADVACYAAKDAGRNRIHVHSEDDNVLRQRHGEMQWVSRLGKALEENRFLLYCQPVVGVAGGQRTVEHYEILLRLQDEAGKIVPPGAFIPAAERYNLMPQIDRWVIRETLALLANQPPGAAPIVVAINVSGQSLGEKDFLAFVIEAIDNSGVPPQQVCFEITETAAIASFDGAIRFITILRGMGCVFALDDFGSGLSSFNYLKNLRVDYLKLDGYFVKEMLNNPIDHALVEATNQIGHAMGIKTIAEFVENQDILDALRKIGVDYAQGYGIARPCPVEDIFLTAAEPRKGRKAL